MGWPSLSALLLLGLVCLVWLYWRELDPAHAARTFRSFLLWTGKGLLLPLIIWFDLNSGAITGVGPWLVSAGLARAAGGFWLPGVLTAISPTSLQVSLAFHRLADWHLKFADDPEGARYALGEIVRRLPGGHFARMAQLRIDQLPHTPAELKEQRAPKPMRLPALQDDLEPRPLAPLTDNQRQQGLAELARLRSRLAASPGDLAVREQIACVLADGLGRVDEALAELQQFLALPEPPPDRMPTWLAWGAAWHIRYRGDLASARPYLERLVHEYPQSPQAFAAQRRLNLMAMEAKVRGETTSP